jgi:ABC-2 type transport system permease protein
VFLGLVAQEFGLLRRVSSLWGLGLMLLVLTVLAAVSGSIRVTTLAEIVAERADAELAVRSSLISSLERYTAAGALGDVPVAAKPGSMGFSVTSAYTAMPAAPLAPLAVGVSDLLPHYYRLDAHGAYTLVQGGEIENPLNLRVGGFDVAFVMVFLLPIIVIALTYDIMSREKELGVLALIGAQGLRLSTFIAAKVIARGVLIALMIVAANAMAIGIAVYMGAQWHFGAAALWVAIAVLYGLVWFALAVLINALGFGSSTNGVVLANIWLVFVIVVPAVVKLAATTLYPAPSRVALTTELREAASEADERAADAREAYMFDHPEMVDGDVDQEIFFRQVALSERDIAASIEPEFEAFEAQAQRQAALMKWLKYSSPALLASDAFTALSGTDRTYHAAFRAAVLDYHQSWQAFFIQPLLREELLTAQSWGDLPVFDYQPARRYLQNTAISVPILVLLVLGAVLVVAGLARYRRYSHI